MTFSGIRTIATAAAFMGLAVAQASASPVGPSFDCSKAQAADERAICADPELSALEAKLSDQFKYALSVGDANMVRKLARGILQRRRDCKADAACLKQVMAQGLKMYNDDDTSDTPAGAPTAEAQTAAPADPARAQPERDPIPHVYYHCQMTATHRDNHGQYFQGSSDSAPGSGDWLFIVDEDNKQLNYISAEFGSSSIWASQGNPFQQSDGTMAPARRTYLLDRATGSMIATRYDRTATVETTGSCTHE